MADTLEGCLYLARDPFGIKPLYWRLLPDDSLVFASEVRPLTRLAPGIRVDDAAVARYLHYGAMAADQSPFLEITAVPPNSIAVVRQGPPGRSAAAAARRSGRGPTTAVRPGRGAGGID